MAPYDWAGPGFLARRVEAIATDGLAGRRPVSAATDSAARVRELAAARPPAGLDSAHLAAWYANQFGALAWHAGALANAAERAAERATAGAEQAARITAAAAVRADFERASLAYVNDGTRADWATWAQRLSLALGGLVDAGPDTAGIAADPRVTAAARFLAGVIRAEAGSLTADDTGLLRLHLALVLDAIAGRPR